MAKKRVRGTCRLCLKDRVLRKSHYVGHAIQRLCRLPGEDPILMTPKVIMATPRQLWAHLLCQACEDRLNRLGENVVLKWLDNNRGFRLLEWMQRSCVVKEEGGVVTFSARDMGIDTEPFAHFGLGLLWRGAVHRWKTVEGQTTSVNLGPYEDSIRRYLLGEVGLPDGVYVILAVCTDKGSRGMVFAPSLVGGARHQMFSILVRGLWFHIVVDKNAKAGTKEVCCVRSEKKVLHLENCEDRFLHAGRHVHKTARIAPNVKEKKG
jgi:hypothetical protein